MCGWVCKKMRVVDLRIWRGKCNSPPSKDFRRGSCWGGQCLWKRECCKSGCDDVCDVDVGAPCKLVFGVPFFEWLLRFGVWGTVHHGLRLFSIRRSVTVMGGA